MSTSGTHPMSAVTADQDEGPARYGPVPGESIRRPGAIKFGIACTYLACFTTPWTAVGLGPLRLGDIFLFLAVVGLLAGDLDVRLPRFPEWVWIFALTILFVGVAHEFFPVSPAYQSTREFGGTVPGQIVRGAPPVFSNFGVMVKFLVPILGLPLLFGLARTHDSRVLRRGAVAFAAGAAISAFIAFTDVEGLTAIAQQVSGIAVEDARGAGLTEHPNYVAMGCVFGLPLMLWQVLAPRARDRVLASFGAIALLLGLYASGSRSGAGAGAAVLVLSVVLIPRFRRYLPVVALVLAVILAAAFVAIPSLGGAILKGLRLTGDAGEGSDIARNIVNTQAQHDFFHSPYVGIGFQVAGEAHIVYLQALAAGGLVLLTGYVIFLLGALVRSYRLIGTEAVAAPLFVSILGGTIFNAAQDALTLRIVYLPATIAAMLPLVRRGADAYTDADQRVQ